MANLILVERSFAQARHEQFPETAGDVLPHGMAAAVPVVEIADHADARGVGGPDGEVHAVDAVDLPQLRPQPVVALPVPAFVQQVEVVVGQQVRKGVGIVHGRGLLAAFLGHPKHVPRRAVADVGNGQIASNKPGRMDPPHGQRPVAVRRIDDPRLARRGQKRPHRQRPPPRLVDLVRTEQLKWVLMPSFNQLTDRFQRHRRSHTNLLAGKLEVNRTEDSASRRRDGTVHAHHCSGVQPWILGTMHAERESTTDTSARDANAVSIQTSAPGGQHAGRYILPNFPRQCDPPSFPASSPCPSAARQADAWPASNRR